MVGVVLLPFVDEYDVRHMFTFLGKACYRLWIVADAKWHALTANAPSEPRVFLIVFRSIDMDLFNYLAKIRASPLPGKTNL